MRVDVTQAVHEVVLPKAPHHNNKDRVSILKSQDENKINQTIEYMGNKALRTIAISFKSLRRDMPLDIEFLEKDLTFIGLYGMIDPPRREVKTAIEECKQAGIKTVMITGDHIKTAEAIAKDLNLLPQDGLVLEGRQLNQMSLEELENIIEDVYVFARVTPEHKLKIVQALQDKGHVVAMTGDGVN